MIMCELCVSVVRGCVRCECYVSDINFYSAGIDFKRQNLTSGDVSF